MNRKVNIDRPELSSEEIAQVRDFDSLLEQHLKGAGSQSGGPASKPFYKSGWFIGGTSVLAVGAIVAVILTSPPTPTEQATDLISDQTVELNEGEVNSTSILSTIPFDHIEIERAEYTVDPTQPNEIVHTPSGSKIIIPEDAFLDGSGNVIEDPVKVRYHEFTDASQIFAAGIPMTYADEFHFESDGMLEIRAYVNGEEVFANPDKHILVEMAAAKTSDNFDMYYLNEESNAWEMIGGDNLIYKDELLASGDDDLIDLDLSNWEHLEMEINEAEQAFNDAEQALQLCIANKPVEPKKVDPTKERFKPVFSADEFPELAQYENLLFEVGAENPAGILSSYDGQVVGDMLITPSGTKGTYDVRFGTGSNIIEVSSCIPVYEGASYLAAMDQYTNNMEAYALNKQEITQQRDEAKAEFERLLELRPVSVPMMMTGDASLSSAYHPHGSGTNEAIETLGEVLRVFTIHEFGVYNCDSRELFPVGTTVAATFELNGEQVEPSFIYLSEKDRVVMFTYYTNQLNEFKFDPNANNVAWTVTKDGKLAVISEEQFRAVDAHATEHRFTLTTHVVANVSDITKCLGL